MTLSITSRLVIQAAQTRGWMTTIHPVTKGLYTLVAPDGTEYLLKGLQTHKTSALGKFIADQKEATGFIAKRAGVPVPATEIYSDSYKQAVPFLNRFNELVIKPSNAAHGNGVTVGVRTLKELENAFSFAQKYSKKVIAQEHVYGDDYRVLIIGGKLAGAVIRRPAFVTGDGVHTLAELIQLENESDMRAAGYQEKLTHIDLHAAQLYLGEHLLSVPDKGVEITVVGTANVGKGGAAIDITDTINSTLVAEAIKVTGLLGLGVCGVDFIVNKEGKHYLIEANAAPSLGLHEYPYAGKARNTPDAFIDWLAQPVQTSAGGGISL